MTVGLPVVSRTYVSWCLDSTRWQRFAPRGDEIVVTTPYKSGTTWMIHIVGHLLFNDLRQREHTTFGRWIDANFQPVDGDLAALEQMPHRRVMKTHLALDALPYDHRLRYIYVGRDLRDIFMSLWNHHTNYTPEMWAKMSDRARDVGVAMAPPPPDDIHRFWHDWITRSQFEWEPPEGYPYWSTLHHLRTWWEYRHLHNILFVHFNDLLADLPREIARVASFLGLERGTDRYAEIASLSSISAMRRDGDLINPGAHFAFRGGPTTFINRGTNGRWRGVLTDPELAQYDWAMWHLPGDAAAWLETGQAAAREAEWSI